MDLFALNFLQDILLSENGTIQNSIHAVCLKNNKNMLAYDQKIAGLASILAKTGCLWDGEGGRPFFFLNLVDIVLH